MTESDKKKDVELFSPKATQLCTKPYYTFLRRHRTIFDFFFFAIEMATTMDKQRLAAAKALALTESEENRKILKKAEENKDAVFNVLKRFSEYQSETISIRLVDNFLCFISEIIQICMLRRPEMLKSSEMVKIEEILRFSRRSEIVRFLVDRKINELSYSGILDIGDFLYSRTGISLAETEAERELLTLAVELRNIYTHNRGKADERFLRRIGNANSIINAEQNRRFHADFDLIADLANSLFVIAERLDKQTTSKFKLGRKRYNTWYRRKNLAPTESD